MEKNCIEINRTTASTSKSNEVIEEPKEEVVNDNKDEPKEENKEER